MQEEDVTEESDEINADAFYANLVAQESELHRRSVQNLLIKAITEFSSIEDMETILKFGADATGITERGMQPIHYAAYANNIEAIDLLLTYGSEVNPKDDFGFTPVHLCADKGHSNCLRHLIEHGAVIQGNRNYVDPEPVEAVKENTNNDGGQTTETDGDNLNVPEAENNEGTVNEGEGENVVSDGASGRIPEELMNDIRVEPLNLALENNHFEIVKILLENGANPNRRYFGGHEINLMPMKFVECLELLLDYGANPNVYNRCGLTPLMVASKENETRAVRLLASKGANIDQQCHERFEQRTALHLALEAGHRGVVRTLCLKNATVSRVPNYKYNALHTAILTDRIDLVELILLMDIDIDEVTDDNCTALMMACASTDLKNQKEIIYKLLQYGANPNYHSDITNYSAPYLSALIEYIDNEPLPDYDIVLKLIQYGAKVHFTRRTTVVRQKDPFGIIPYLPVVMRKPDLWNLLINVASRFDAAALSHSTHFSQEEQEMYSSLGLKPLSLKHIVRLSIREMLQRPIIEKILKLPLPVFLLKYILFLTT